MLHSFYTISDLNYAIFNFLVVFFLLTIKEKKYNIYNLAFLFFILGLMALSYFFAFGLVEEYWAYHRWISVGVSLVGTAQLSNFLLHYPEKSGKHLPKIALLYQIIALAITSVFVMKSIEAPKEYHFDGHFWDVHLPQLSKIVALVILILMVLAVITGYTKAFLGKKENRLPLLYITTGYIFVILVPGITNALNRAYLLPRDVHHNVWVLSGIFGTFIVLITYINYTKEKTTLLTKLYSISIASIIVIVQFSSFFILKEREKNYDLNQIYKSGRIVKDDIFRPDDMILYGKLQKDFTIKEIYNKNNKISLKDLYDKGELALQLFRINLEKNQEPLENIPTEEHEKIKGYLKWFEALKNEGRKNQEILSTMYSNQNKILYLRQSIKELSDDNFKERYKKEIYEKRKDKPIEKYFIQEIGLDKNKQEVLERIPILYKDGERIYQLLDSSGKDFWNQSFIMYYYNIQDELYYLVYNYKSYREYVDEVARILLYITLIATLSILLSYPIFFYLSIIKPLKRLVSGLQEVDKGNLNVYIDVYVEDELGYVTRSFNKMVDSIRDKNKQLEEYANMLELKVEERTRDLEKSLKEIEKLKEKQDGDYFLTSLLLKPLNVNEVNDDGIVKVETKIDYFKKFQFRHWNSEIGGDFCCAHKITLRGKEYIFCVNADAMGKSIQGAGGALVLGSVLEAIVERTKYDDIFKEQYPEQWLKNAFVEIHKVFESFDGSMLVSCILVLLDKREGCVYHINAEHPNMVLLSGDSVKFVVPKKIFLKLGVVTDGLIEISVLRLKEGDRLILGSDGKDDLILGEENGARVINTDENLFLEIVKESQGDLENIYQNLKERGVFMDDLSLLSVEFKGDKDWFTRSRYMHKEDKALYDQAVDLLEQGKNEEAYKILIDLKNRYNENGIIRKRFGYSLLRLGNIKESIVELEIAKELLPWDSEILKILSKAYFKIREYEKAKEYGELYLLRESNDKEMMKYLIEVYERLKLTQKDKYKEIAERKIQKYQKYLV